MAELNQQRTLKQLDEEDEFKLVEKRINALVSTSTKEELKKTIPIVLISTGSLSPIHLLHVRVLEIAKKELESQDSRIKVIGGFVSPSHDDYTSSKLGSEWIPSEDRLRLCRLALKDHEFISVSSWECKQKHFVDFPYVTEAIQAQLRTRFKHLLLESGIDSILVCLYVCGMDHVVKCRLENGIRLGGSIQFPVVCIDRPGSPALKNSTTPKYHPYVNSLKMFYFVQHQTENADASSTTIRKLLKRYSNEKEKTNEIDKEILKLTWSDCLEYLKSTVLPKWNKNQTQQ